MRRLAQELGAGAASLYWHVGDKEELLSLLLDRIVGEVEVPEPDPEHWQDTIKEMARSARRMFAQRRDAAQLSLGRIPSGPNSLPVLERNLAVLAASALPPRVIAYAADMFALYVGAFAYEESIRSAARVRRRRSSSAPTGPRCRPSSSRSCRASPATWSRAAPTSASSSRSSCSSAGSKRWAAQLSEAVRTGSEVGVVEPPTGSVLTITVSTPSRSPVTDAVAEPSRRGVNSADVGSGAWPGRWIQTM